MPGALRLAAFLAGPFASLLIALLPLDLPAQAHTLAAILGGVIAYWILEPIPLPVTALLGTAACVLAGLGSAKTVFAAYGHPIIFLFIGSFLLAEAMAVHGVDRRVACWMLSLGWVQARPRRILLVIGGATAFISMWISNTAATAMLLPVALGILGTLEASGSEALGTFRVGLLLMLSYAATAGGMATIIGTPPNLIGAGLLGEHAGSRLTFMQWMGFGLPIAAMLLIAGWALLYSLHPCPTRTVPGLDRYLDDQRRALGRWTRGQINATIAFLVAVTLWIGPGLLAAALGPSHPLIAWLDARLPNELVALIAAGLLFMLPVDWRAGEFTLSWKQAADINWGIIILFGGGLVFGDLMAQTKLSTAVGQGFIELFGVNTIWSLTAVSIAAGVLISELASNTASASLLVPLSIAIAKAAGLSPIAPALGATLGCSLGFALPVSTAPNALVYGTDLVPMRRMIVAGVLFDAIGAITIWVGLRLLCPVLGLA